MAIPALNGQFGKTRFIVAAEVILLLLLVLFSDGDVPPRVDADLDEEGVVLDVLALLEQFVRHELGEAEAELVDLPARPLEVGPVGVGDEALDDVARPPPVLGLVQQREAHRVLERPLEDGVVLAGQDLDVDGHVGTLAAAVPVEEQGRLQLVAALKYKKNCLLD